jgi:hypothetical protein
MVPVILDKIPFELDLEHLLRTLHAQTDGEDAAKIRELAARAQAVGRPKALYGEAFVESRGDNFVVVDGVKLASRVLTVNLQNAHRLFAYVATCGTELEQWSNSLSDPLERYWADTIKEMALGTASGAFSAHLEERFRPGKTANMNPGSLEDWPMPQQRNLFAILGDVREAIGVELSDSFLMVPVKSVSGIRFPTEVSFESCQLCAREKCPGRRAPYDKDLFEKRYRKK